MKYKFSVLKYNHITEEFGDVVVTGYDQILVADSYEEARDDYVYWLSIRGYFEDHEIPEGREEEAVTGFPVEDEE